MTILLNYPSRAQVIASAGSRPSSSRRQVQNAQSKLPLPAKSQLGNNLTNLICSSTAVADASLHERTLNEFRRGVGLVIVNREGLVFAAKRMDDRENTWQMPQGGIDPYENPLVAARRELQEETGITSVQIVSTIDQWLAYEWPTKVRCDITGQVIRYRGQTQKWMLLHFFGDDKEIDISGGGAPEFSEWRWLSLEELPHSVVDFKKGVYQSVARHFSPQITRLYGKGNISVAGKFQSSSGIAAATKVDTSS